MVKVYLLPADEGDFIWVRYGDDNNFANILIDGGTKDSGTEYADIIQYIATNGETIAALILTHIDYDHIQGVVDGIGSVSPNILKKVVKRVLFNTCKGIAREHGQAIDENGYVENQIIGNKYTGGYGIGDAIALMDIFKEKDIIKRVMDYVVSGMEMIWEKDAHVRIISLGKDELNQFLNKWEPYCAEGETSAYTTNLESTRENLMDLMEVRLGNDPSINNAASIAFLFEYEDVKIAFLAGAKPPVCINGLKKLKIDLPYKVDLLKLSHHGSKSNTFDALLENLRTKIYMLSTNGSRQKVPNKVVVAHLLKNTPESQITLACNYDWWENAYYGKYFTDKDRETYIDRNKLKLVRLDEFRKNIRVCEGDGEQADSYRPELYFSTAQLNTVAFSSFFSRALTADNIDFRTIFIDDPIGHFDDMNILGFTDLIRSILETNDCQIIMYTHDEKIFKILERKLNSDYYSSCFRRLPESDAVTWSV